MSTPFERKAPGLWISVGDLSKFRTFKPTNVGNGGLRLENVGTPIDDTDAANKDYVDNNPNSLSHSVTSPVTGDTLVYNGSLFINSSKLMDACNQIVAIKYQTKPVVTAISTSLITVDHGVLAGFWSTSGIRVYKNYVLAVNHTPITADPETFSISATGGDIIQVQTYISDVDSALSIEYIVDVEILAANVYDANLGITVDQKGAGNLSGTYSTGPVLNGNQTAYVALTDRLKYPSYDVRREFRTSTGGAFAAVVQPISGTNGIIWGVMGNSLLGWALWQKTSSVISIRIRTNAIYETDITVNGNWVAVVASSDGTTVNWAVNGVLGLPFVYTSYNGGYSWEKLTCGAQDFINSAYSELNVAYLSYFTQPLSTGAVQLYCAQLATRFGL